MFTIFSHKIINIKSKDGQVCERFCIMTICPGLDEVAQVLPFSVVSWFEQQIAFNQFYLWFLCQIDESLQIFLGMVTQHLLLQTVCHRIHSEFLSHWLKWWNQGIQSLQNTSIEYSEYTSANCITPSLINQSTNSNPGWLIFTALNQHSY